MLCVIFGMYRLSCIRLNRRVLICVVWMFGWEGLSFVTSYVLYKVEWNVLFRLYERVSGHVYIYICPTSGWVGKEPKEI